MNPPSTIRARKTDPRSLEAWAFVLQFVRRPHHEGRRPRSSEPRLLTVRCALKTLSSRKSPPARFCSKFGPAACAAPTCSVTEGELPSRRSPLIPGHQIVGEVAAGETLELPLGMRVGVSWIGGTDGSCWLLPSPRKRTCANAPTSHRIPAWTAVVAPSTLRPEPILSSRCQLRSDRPAAAAPRCAR